MTDTVVAQYPLGTYRVNDPERFKPYFYPIDSTNIAQRIKFSKEYRGNKKYTLNPSKLYRDEGVVYPNLTITERIDKRTGIYTCNLDVSISLPKLLWGHSFQETKDDDFSDVVFFIIKRLFEIGVSVKDKETKESIIKTLHYCCNLLFPSMEEARIFLDRLSKCSLNKWFENSTKTFSNDGEAIRFHTNVFEIVFYLKYYDVLQKNARSMDRHKTLQEKEIARQALKADQIPPLVRMELRFNGVKSVRSHLKASLGIDKPRWTLEEVFSSLKSRNVLAYYWNEIISDPLNNAYLSTTSDEDVCRRVHGKFKGEKIRLRSEALGLFYQLKNLGTKGLRNLIELEKKRKYWIDKRRKLIDFLNNFVKQDDTLINFVTDVLGNKPTQLKLPFVDLTK